MKWLTTIGLEIHVQLNTRSKLFSRAANTFGQAPNTCISVICTGQPGTLPLLNRAAVIKAIQFGCAIGAEIATVSSFDRKSYFYPDNPKNYQITQFHQPLLRGGAVTCLGHEEKRVAIARAHLEEDAGMLKHFPHFSGVDFNRAGVPLLEIVSAPVLQSAAEAVALARSIKMIMQYIDASDCNMEEGSLRVDANVSVRPTSEQALRNKVEIKNMNSFAHIEMAIEAEIARQIAAYQQFAGQDPSQVIVPATYRFDAERKEMVLLRSKEEAQDYRYFPEPDLPPLRISAAEIAGIRAALPELPAARRQRYIETLSLPPHAADQLISDKALADYFDAGCTTCRHPQLLCNWIRGEFVGRAKEKRQSLPQLVPAGHIAELVNLLAAGKIHGKIAKTLAERMIEKRAAPEALLAADPQLQPLSDDAALVAIIDAVLHAHPRSLSDYRRGKQRALTFLMGQIMQRTQGKAPPQRTAKLLRERLDA